MTTDSEEFERWSKRFVEINQQHYAPIILKILREKLGEDIELQWKTHNFTT